METQFKIPPWLFLPILWPYQAWTVPPQRRLLHRPLAREREWAITSEAPAPPQPFQQKLFLCLQNLRQPRPDGAPCAALAGPDPRGGLRARPTRQRPPGTDSLRLAGRRQASCGEMPVRGWGLGRRHQQSGPPPACIPQGGLLRAGAAVGVVQLIGQYSRRI